MDSDDFLLLLVPVLGLALAACAVFSHTHFDGLSSWVQASAAVAAVYLTWALKAITASQVKIAKEQVRIADQQRELMRGTPFLFLVCNNDFALCMNSTGGDRFTTHEKYQFSVTPTVKFRIKNYGSSPAILFAIKARVTIGSDPPNETPPPQVLALPNEIVLQPRIVSEPLTVQMGIKSRNISRDEYIALDNGVQSFWFFGSVVFDDFSGDRRVLEFCWRYDHSLKIFQPFPRSRNKNRRLP